MQLKIDLNGNPYATARQNLNAVYECNETLKRKIIFKLMFLRDLAGDFFVPHGEIL